MDRNDPTPTAASSSVPIAKPRPTPFLTGLGTLLLIALVIAGWWYSSRVREQTAIFFSGPTMGTTYTVKTAQVPKGVTREALQAGVEGILAQINRQMSTYDSQSELSRFNQNPSTDWVAVSPELLAVIQEALRVSALTRGAFDVTVGPLVDLWGFGPQPKNDAALPSEQAIQEVLARVGYRRIETRTDPPAIKKERADMTIDLNAIAQGYAADRVAGYLESLGIGNYLVDTGGELRVRGHNAEGALWRIAIEEPSPDRRAIERIIRLTDQGIATSGSYRNFFEKDGQRYSHEIDPQAGRPIRHNLVSVTVVHPSAAFADAVSTALMVLGSERGFKLAEEQGLAAFFIESTPAGFQEKSTAAFQQYLGNPP